MQKRASSPAPSKSIGRPWPAGAAHLVMRSATGKKAKYMKPTHIERHFAAMGARFRITGPAHNRQDREGDYAIDIKKDREGEFFELRIPAAIEPDIKIDVLQKTPGERHLLLLVKTGQGRQVYKDRFLCGHDERSWFVAAVPGNASTVAQAREALKPFAVRAAQSKARISASKGNLRKNDAFRRQGEWFFVPAPRLVVDPKTILQNEPIRRGGGKPHMLQEAYRTGGERVYVHRDYPNGVLTSEYRKILARGKTSAGEWKGMTRNAVVYARGTVRHLDHKTITLHGWHRVHMSAESQAASMQQVAFLD